MTVKQLKEEIASLADYLGCNAGELENELLPLFEKHAEQVAADAVEDALWHERVGQE